MDPYRVLGVSRDASTDEIKKVYRKLARETHPDLNPGDETAEKRFKEVSVAYEILSDEEKRRNYDEFGEIALEAGFDADAARAQREAFSSRFGGAGAGGQAGAFDFGGIDDFLRQFQGGGPFQGGGRAGAGRAGAGFRMRGTDAEASMGLEFTEAALGGERKISISRPTADGRLVEETITVRIPPGVTDGGRLRIPGKGGEGVGGGPPGDLWVSVRVAPHPFFRRSGKNLELDLPLTLREAVQGARVEVPTLQGRVTLTVPPGTSSGARLRMRGEGIPGGRKGPDGDLIARVQVIVPDPEHTPPDLLEALEGLEMENPRTGLFR
ncbi:MAG TPA: J domain-containing protein [Myxococcota bacterium]|nr:J domain-containing protein [Myxococcota bacterium]